MEKMNNKGFLLVETIVVATFVLTVLVVIFLQFKNLIVTYNNSYNYNTVEGIYNLNAIKTYILEYQSADNTLNKQLSSSSTPFLVIYNGSCSADLGLISIAEDGYCNNLMRASDFKTVIFADLRSLKAYIKQNSSGAVISEDMKNLIRRLSTDDNQSRLIAEFNDGTFASIVFGDDATDDDVVIPEDERIEGCITTPELRTKNGAANSLYSDSYESGRYIYKGATPKNYINFNGEKWRIMAIEKDGRLKLVKGGSIGNRAYDEVNQRTTGYCSSGDAKTKGCNVWSKMDNFINDAFNGPTSKAASLNTYLTSTYYNSLSAKSFVKTGNYTIGPVSLNNDNLSSQIIFEKSFTGSGAIGLITLSDYLKANSNTTSCATFKGNNDNAGMCKNTNYMIDSIPSGGYLGTVNPVANTTSSVLYISSNGMIVNQSANFPTTVIPSLYLTEKVQLRGEGTQSEPYTICE